MDNDCDTMCLHATRRPLEGGRAPSARAKIVLEDHLCDRKPSEHASGEAFRTLDDAYDPAALPELHGRMQGHMREVHDDQ